MSDGGKKFSISPGHPWNIVEAGHGLAASVFFYGRDNEESCRTRDVVQARAALIADALNVHHETGLTPSEMCSHKEAFNRALKKVEDALGVEHTVDLGAPAKRVAQLVASVETLRAALAHRQDRGHAYACTWHTRDGRTKSKPRCDCGHVEADAALEATKAVGE